MRNTEHPARTLRPVRVAAFILCLLSAGAGLLPAAPPDPLGDGVVAPRSVPLPVVYLSDNASSGSDGTAAPVPDREPSVRVRAAQGVGVPLDIVRRTSFSWGDYSVTSVTQHGKLPPPDDQGDMEGASWIFAALGNLAANSVLNDYPGTSTLPGNYVLADYSEQDILNFYTNPTGNAFRSASYLSLHGSVSEGREDWLAELLPWNAHREEREKNVTQWHYRGNLSGVAYEEIPRGSKLFYTDNPDIGLYNVNIQTIKAMVAQHGPVSAQISLKKASSWVPDSKDYDARWSETGGFAVPYAITRAAPEDLDNWVEIVGWDDYLVHKSLNDNTDNESDRYFGAWLVKYSQHDTCNEGRGFAWVGYGAAGIGSDLNYFDINGTRDYDPQVTQLACDTGWDGAYSEAGQYMLVRYVVPPLEGPGPHQLYAVDVFSPRCDMTATLRVYRNFDGHTLSAADLAHPEQVRVLDTAGLQSVPLDKPFTVEEGETLALWLRLTDEGGRKRIPVSTPNARIRNIKGVFNDILKQGHYVYLAGKNIVRLDVNDPANPKTVNTLEGLAEECIRLVPVGNRLVAGLYRRQQGDFVTLNKTLSLDAGSDQLTTLTPSNYPFFVMDVYNPSSWRFIDLTLPRYADAGPGLPSGWWNHPLLGGGFEDRKRMLFNDPLLASSGERLLVAANRYQDRYENGGPDWPFWWDFASTAWDFTDPYNPTLLPDQIYAYSPLTAGTGGTPDNIAAHRYWYHDYDATGQAATGQDASGAFNNKLYGPGYVLDTVTGQSVQTDLIDKNPVSFLGRVNRRSTACVASIVNSRDKSPRDSAVTRYPGDPGDILITDVSGAAPQLLATIRAMDEGNNPGDLTIPFPAEDIAVVDNFLFVADGQAGCIVIDIANPADPKKRSEFLTPNAKRLVAWSHLNKPVYYIYVADAQDGLVVLAYRGSQEFIDLNNACYFSPTGEDNTWVDLFESERQSIVLRGRIAPEPAPRLMADVNGDTRADAVTFEAAGVQVALGQAGGGFSPPALWVANFGSDQGWQTDRNLRMTADVNGDGCQDIVGFADNGVLVSLAKKGSTGFSDPVRAVEDFGGDNGWDILRHPRFLADVDGDYRDDVVGFAEKGVLVSISNGSGFNAPARWVNGFGYRSGWRSERHIRQVVDVNGDGRADVVGFGDKGVEVSYSTGSGFGTPVPVSSDFCYNRGWTLERNPRLLADVNGDRRADIVAFGNRAVQVALATAGGFLPTEVWLSDLGYSQGWRTERHPRLMADVNGDGYQDIVGFFNDGTVAALSRGTRFDPAVRWSASFGYGANRQILLSGQEVFDNGWSPTRDLRVPADVNGDGKSDLVGFDARRVLVGLSDGTRFADPVAWLTPSETIDAGEDDSLPLGPDSRAVRVGDVNGDGLADYVVTVDGAVGARLVFGASDRISGAAGLSAAAGVPLADAGLASVSAGSASAAGDVNGDRLADFVLGLEGRDAAGREVRRVYLVHGRSDADWTAGVSLHADREVPR